MIVVIQVVGIVGEIGFDDIGPAVVIVVGGVDAHAGLLASVGAVGDARFRAHFGETAFAVVVVKQAGRRVVRHIKIEAAVEVIVQPENAQSVVASGIDLQLLGDIGEGAVAVVVIKPVAAAF